jgi:hypothetical protein
VNEEGGEDCWGGEEGKQRGATGETRPGDRGWRKRPIHYAGIVSLLERRHDKARRRETSFRRDFKPSSAQIDNYNALKCRNSFDVGRNSSRSPSGR